MDFIDDKVNPGEVVSASAWRAMAAEVLRLGKIAGGPGISVTQSAAGVVVAMMAAGAERVGVGVIVERMGAPLDASGKGLGAEVWYRVAYYGHGSEEGRRKREPSEVTPERIMRAFATDSPIRLTPWAVNDLVPVMITPARMVEGVMKESRMWIIAGERYGSRLCGSGGGAGGGGGQ